jgi:AraC-like DNA-binding protein
MKFIYNHTQYTSFLDELARQTNSNFDGTVFTFSPQIGMGTIRFVEFPNGLQGLISNYVLSSDIIFHRLGSLPEVFFIRADYIQMSHSFEARIGQEEYIDESSLYANILMHSSRSSLELLIKKGTTVKSIVILLEPAWFSTYFPQDIAGFWLNYIHVLSLKGVNMVPINFEARQSLFSIVNTEPSHPAYFLILQTKVFELLDYYYKQVVRLQDQWKNLSKIMEDVGKIIEMDVLLTSDFSKPFPVIEEMAEKAGMSPTKLKSLFKKIYNESLYDYLNKSRLQKARQMIIADLTNIKEVSNACGYKSVQHFTSSFKKEFQITPGELLQLTISKK